MFYDVLCGVFQIVVLRDTTYTCRIYARILAVYTPVYMPYICPYICHIYARSTGSDIFAENATI
jgi:hypothetical protein